MENIKFKTLEELYNKLLPAFRCKVSDLKRNNINNINEKDIWDYLKINYWSKKQDLTLADMVNDILSLSNNEIVSYIIKNNRDKNIL